MVGRSRSCAAAPVLAAALAVGCGGSDSSVSSSGADASVDAGGGCATTSATTATSHVSSSGCAVETRDTGACEAARKAQGLSGFWLAMSCRVTLTVSGGVVTAKSDGLPDHVSNYFAKTDACHEDYTGAIQNPNTIASKTYEVSFSLTPDVSPQQMHGAVVGLALSGVPIFANFAAPGDDIFQEAATFDRCGGHPQMQGAYHYHSEPLSISNDDSAFIGVMRDGYPIYGRHDADGSMPTLDEATGGHMAVTLHSPSTPVFHYHVNQQTSTANKTAGTKQWFLTKGMFEGTPGACARCN